MKEKLKNIFLDNIDEYILDELINKGKIISIQKGDKVVSYGQTKNDIYILLEGSLIRNITTSDGVTKTVMFHTFDFLPIVTSIDNYFFKTTTEYDIIANENTNVLEVHFDLFNYLIEQNHSLAIFCTNYMIKKYYITEVFRNNLISKTPKQFLQFLYSEYPFFFQKFSSYNIASFMGITPEWLSKTKRKLFS